MSDEIRHITEEPEKVVAIDAEYLSGHRFPYQEDIALVEDVDLLAATPGDDINWLQDIPPLEEEGMPAVFRPSSPATRTRSSGSTSRSRRAARTSSRGRC